MLVSCRRAPLAPPRTITISLPYGPQGVDPHAHDRLSTFAVLSHIYEPLVASDAGMAIVPALASRWESPDPLTWIFHLRDGVTFASGRALTADDVVATLERLRGKEDLQMSGYATDVAIVEAIDPRTIRLRTSQPTATLLSKLRFVLIVPRGFDAAAPPDGTGPYRLAERRDGDRVRLVAREGYWGPRPALAEVVFRERGPREAIADFVSGDSQLVQSTPKELATAVPGVRDGQLVRQSSLFVKYLGFDLADPDVGGAKNPFRDVRIRRAIHLAIDRSRLVKELSTFAVPASQPVPPFVVGFNPALAEPTRDLAEARRLLAEAGHPDGLDVTLTTSTRFSDAAQAVANLLAGAGIRVRVEALPLSEYDERIEQRNVSMFLAQFGCLSGEAGEVLEKGIHTPDPARHIGTMNYGRYSNPALDQKIEAAAKVPSLVDRRDALQHLIAEIMKELVWVPLYNDQDVFAIRKPYVWKPRNDGLVLAWEIGIER